MAKEVLSKEGLSEIFKTVPLLSKFPQKKMYNEPLRQELNVLRVKIANKILQKRTNIQYLKNPDGSYNTEILNEITTRWITRFLSLKIAEDFGLLQEKISPYTLGDIRRSFELYGSTARPVQGAKVKEETLSNAIKEI